MYLMFFTYATPLKQILIFEVVTIVIYKRGLRTQLLIYI